MSAHPDPVPAPHVHRFARAVLIAFGILWGFWYLGMDRIGWGEPGSPGYARYESFNRLLPLVLLPLAIGLHAVRPSLHHVAGRGASRGIRIACVGLGTMVVGNVLEFWWFTLAPYAPGSMRGLGWTTYCAGLLVCFLGTARLGVGLRRVSGLLLPATLLATWLLAAPVVTGVNRVLGTPVPPLSIAVALGGLGLALLGLRLPGSEPSPRPAGRHPTTA